MIRTFNLLVPGSKLVLLAADAVVVSSCYAMAAYQSPATPGVYLPGKDVWAIGMVVPAVLAGVFFGDLYKGYLVSSRIQLVRQVCLALGISFLIESFLNYAAFHALPLRTMLYGSLYVLIALPLLRIALAAAARNVLGSRRLLFLGSSPLVREIIARVGAQPVLGFRAVGFLDDSPDAPPNLAGIPRLGALADLAQVVAAHEPYSVVVGLEQFPAERLLNLRLSGTQVDEAETMYELIFHRVPASMLSPAQSLSLAFDLGRRLPVRPRQDLGRIFGAACLVAAFPVMVAIAIGLTLTSPGPVLVRHRRVGLHGVPFTSFQFRTVDTRLSRWVGNLGLNALPQLFNVVRGEMVIIGPRAERLEFASILGETLPFYPQRHSVNPGLTGWAQIHEGSHGTMEDTSRALEYDLYYIKNRAPWLDLYLLLRSVKAALSGGL